MVAAPKWLACIYIHVSVRACVRPWQTFPALNSFVFPTRILIFCMMVHYPKAVCRVLWFMNFDLGPQGQIKDFICQFRFQSVTILFSTRFMIFHKRVDHLMTMCRVPWFMTLELWLQGRINDFSLPFRSVRTYCVRNKLVRKCYQTAPTCVVRNATAPFIQTVLRFFSK